MTKPSQSFCWVDVCPICGQPGQGVWYMPEDRSIIDRLEFVIHHGINGQISGALKAQGRNYFHFTGVYRSAKEGEIVMTYRARPRIRPNWGSIRKRFQN